MKTYHFETLPVHPQPQEFESFCSYTMRLAAANGINQLSRWWLVCYPTGNPRVTDHTGDFTPFSFGQLCKLAACPEPVLQQTTFYHLVKKFGCTTKPQPMSSFLAGSIASHLRYCPRCLAERNYYRLTWRFPALSGCAEHGCELCYTCGHCEQLIPLLPGRLKVGLCPHCGQDLSRCPSRQLDEATWQKVQARERDLAYLLSPQPIEGSVEGLKERLGEQFAYRRLSRRLKVVTVARDLGYKVSIFHGLESPSEKLKCGKFSIYLDYADYLEVDFQTLFEAPPPEETYEDILVDWVQQTITSLTQTGQWVTQEELAQRTGLDMSTFERYPKLKALWGDFLTQRRQARYASLVDQIRQIAAELETEGKRVSVNEISRRMARHPTDMGQYAQTRAVMKEVTGPAAQARYEAQQEERLLQLIEQATADLEARNEPISKTAICRETGVCLTTLEKRPQVRAYLAEQISVKAVECRIRHRQQREAEWLSRVQQGIERLRANDQPVTIAAICQMVNKSEHGLRSYPSVDALLQRAVQTYQDQQRQQREAELLALVQQAAETLRTTGQTVTIRAICQTIRKSENGLRTYPSVAAFFKQVVAANK